MLEQPAQTGLASNWPICDRIERIRGKGYTDNVGEAVYNHRLGLERAETVKRYLYEHHQVPLHKINVISYGEQKPVSPNTTRAGRAQNRRVVVRILS